MKYYSIFFWKRENSAREKFELVKNSEQGVISQFYAVLLLKDLKIELFYDKTANNRDITAWFKILNRFKFFPCRVLTFPKTITVIFYNYSHYSKYN